MKTAATPSRAPAAPSFDEPPAYPSRPELALAALLLLLTRYPATRTPALARAIVAHLQTVGDDPRLAEGLRECATGLVAEWEGYLALSADEGPAPPLRRLC